MRHSKRLPTLPGIRARKTVHFFVRETVDDLIDRLHREAIAEIGLMAVRAHQHISRKFVMGLDTCTLPQFGFSIIDEHGNRMVYAPDGTRFYDQAGALRVSLGDLK